ncbi:NAD(+)/NADH kinase [Mesoplasma coleopterae]|uniref:Inorganic polyphosphate/ATP-NAD kinase n=1 Tax=Mesoplasma coleopterae TaxID=324078 RepID=A0A2K8P569_9MOLU|nr:NAD(+)/NADH kinase [Mesoplasma coleopterae]ATZ20725.1 inorganic polyphosphate/ATP-NAD kinase [Mesoplasma coleopterae]AVN62236.1 NAD(+) kinase [Mesoplasma coleopterae]
MKYSIVKNDYDESKKIAEELSNLLISKKWILDNKNPNYIFVIGGDGTFLKAAELFNNILEEVIFVPIKSGGIGFYTNHNRISDIKDILNNIEKQEPIEISVLEANDYKVINEIKIINNLRPLEVDVLIDGELLETFRGTGLVFSTSGGSTGFAKSHNGAVIIDENNIFQMLEIAPVSNNNFRTLNAPVIFSRKHKVEVVITKPNDVEIIVDSRKCKLPAHNSIKIQLSDKNIKLISKNSEKLTKTRILNYIFTTNKSYN